MAWQVVILTQIKITILGAGGKNWPDFGYILKLVPVVFPIGLDMGFEREMTLVFLACGKRRLEIVFPKVGKMTGGTGWNVQESGVTFGHFKSNV